LTIRARAYIRVSDPLKQEADNQLPAIRDYCHRRGLELTGIYEEGESAWKGGRQAELARAVNDARSGRFSVLLCWSLDRLSREGPLAILSLVHRLARYGCKVVSVTEGWTEALGELGDLLLAVVGWVARWESQRRSERTKAGMARLKAKGVKLGRPLGSKDKHKRKKARPRLPVWGPDAM
jgi:putative DNA-invertase from lambdoid prophage Rac